MSPHHETLDSPSRQLAPGVVLDGRYRLESVLGAGGMAEVWRARHEALDRWVAIKTIHLTFREARARLRAEAVALARLAHPNVVAVHDAGELADGTPYLVLEYVPGESVADLLERSGPLPEAVAVEIAMGVCDGLSAAHRLGIVHRDVKPANILLLAREGTAALPKLADFGIAASRDADGPRLTSMGVVVGTPAYMTPEQLRGERADEACDAWSLAASLHEMVTGRLPFDGDGLEAVVARVLSAELPAHPPPGFDPGLYAIVRRALARDPRERYRRTADLRDALARWSPSPQRTSPPPAADEENEDRPDRLATLDHLIRSKLG